ncbi:hypothetical protein HK105_203377 [Polyrhizophydium stewartii]|uniref:UBC core domain-containing protein n=1 Tax=Polyrhizophydium stewartii TaxID=2732419 RepID=A0ABR4NBP6_9FUNG|nr:hypothetical protein HK105_001490 [Polyrhizophydium stewartii]
MAATKRVAKEYADLTKAPLPNVSVGLDGDDLMNWKGVITGPTGSTYQGGLFRVAIKFPKDYPFKPPKITFRTKIYHPNVDSDGAICLALLKTDIWKPATKISDVLIALAQLLAEPNPDDPLVASIAEQYNQDREKFVKTAKEWVAKYAQ